MEATIDLVTISRINQLLVDNVERQLVKRGWKVPQLAKATGLSASGLYGVVDGSRWPGPDNLDRIARALEVSVAELLTDPTEQRVISPSEAIEVLAEFVKKHST